jgi:hypothetical protein
MKFISLTTVIITAAAMTGAVMASAAGGPDIACTPGNGKHFCRIHADLRLYAYGHPPIRGVRIGLRKLQQRQRFRVWLRK